MKPKMKFKLFFDHGSHVDEMIIEGDTIEELSEIAGAEIKKRNPVDYWSQEL